MKFKQFAEAVIELYKNKETHKMDVIYSCDDEGNSFHPSFYTPNIQSSKDLEIYANGRVSKNVIVIN